jgi:hypothetical protein
MICGGEGGESKGRNACEEEEEEEDEEEEGGRGGTSSTIHSNPLTIITNTIDTSWMLQNRMWRGGD